MTPTAVPVPPQHVEAMWPSIEPHLRRAAVECEWGERELERIAFSGRVLLWAVLDGPKAIGAALTELHGEIAYIALVGGERWRNWRGELKKIEQWAIASECTQIRVDGRRGWERVLAVDGYVKADDGSLVKDLQHGA